jgi:hypothetical protein
VKPTKITKDQAVKIVKAVLYVSVSAGLAYLITLTNENPGLFGVYTVLINGLLVAIKQLFTTPEEK